MKCWLIIGVLLLAFGRTLNAQVTDDTIGAFRFRTSVISAIEGGPFVVQIRCTYTGNVAITVECEAATAFGSGMRGGVTYEGPGECYRPWLGTRDLKPNETLRCAVALHHACDSFATGKHAIELVWSFRSPRKVFNGKDVLPGAKVRLESPDDATIRRIFEERRQSQLVQYRKKLEVQVLPATKQNLVGCINGLESMLHCSQAPADDLDLVLQHVLHHKRPEFLPIAYRLLEHDELRDCYSEIVSRAIQDDDECVSRALGYLCSSNPQAIAVLVNSLVWFKRKPQLLAPENISKLKEAPSIWVRMTAFLLAPGQCEADWVDRLLQELARIATPLSANEIAPYLHALDHNAFQRRVDARRKLISKGDAALDSMKRALQKKELSAEAENNIRIIVKSIEEGPIDYVQGEMLAMLAAALKQPAQSDALDNVARAMAPDARRVLEAIAKNHPSLLITKKAKQILSANGDKATEEKETKRE